MPATVKISHTAAMILRTLHLGFRYGFSVMEQTGLPSGTVYPALRRLERDSLIRSEWESAAAAEMEDRPARKYYTLTRGGELALAAACRRYPLLEKLLPELEVRKP